MAAAQSTPNINDKDHIIATLVTLIQDIYQQHHHSSARQKSGQQQSGNAAKQSQKHVEQVAQIRSLLPELINTHLMMTGSIQDVNQIVQLIRMMIQKLPNGQWIGDADSICFYLFKLIPFLASAGHVRDASLLDNLVSTIRAVINLLFQHLHVLSLFITETATMFNDLQEVAECMSRQQLTYPVLLKCYCELSSSFVNTRSMSFLLLDNLVNNKSLVVIDGGSTQQQPQNTQQQQRQTNANDGIIIPITSLDMLISILAGMLNAICSTFESNTQMLTSVIAPYWYIVSNILRNIKCYNNNVYLIKTSLNTINAFYTYERPEGVNVDLFESLLLTLQYVVTSNDHDAEHKLAQSLRTLSQSINDKDYCSFAELIVQRITYILSTSKSTPLKRTFCQLYQRLLSLSPPVHLSIVNMLPFLNDDQIQSELYKCFKVVFDYSIDNRVTINGTIDQFSSVLLNRLLLLAQSFPFDTFANATPASLTRISQFVCSFGTVFRICKEYHENLNNLLELFIQHINDFYEVVIAQKELTGGQIAVVSQMLALCLHVLMDVVHPNIDLTSSLGSQFKFTLDCIFNLSFLPWNHSLIFKAADPKDFESIKVQCMALLAWTPSTFYFEERRLIYEQALKSLLPTAQTPQSLRVSLDFIALIPLFLVSLTSTNSAINDSIIATTIDTLNKLVGECRNTSDPLILQMIALITGHLSCIQGDHCNFQISPEFAKRYPAEVVINKTNVISQRPFTFDSLVDNSPLLNSGCTKTIWYPRCPCQFRKQDDLMLIHLKPVPVVAKPMSPSDGSDSTGGAGAGGPLFSTLLDDGNSSPLLSEFVGRFLDDHFSLLRDNDEIIRRAIIKCIITLVKRDTSVSKDITLMPLFQRLRPMWPSDSGVSEGVIASMVSLFGKLAKLIDIDTSYFLLIICNLIECLGRTPLLRGLGFDELEQVTRSKTMTTKQLINYLAPTLYPLIIMHLAKNVTVLEELASRVLKTNLSALINITVPYVLPSLFTGKCEDVLNELKRYFDLKSVAESDLLICSVFEHIFMTCTIQETLTSTITYVAEKVDRDVTALIQSVPRRFIYQLTLNLGDEAREAQAVSALKSAHLLQQRLTAPISAMPFEHSLIKDFLGTMDFFTSIMTNRQKTMADKEGMLRAFERLLEFIGYAVNSFRPKIMAFLKLTLKTPLELKAIQIWSKFVKKLDINSVGPILNLILFSVLPFVPGNQEAAAEIFEYLIITKGASLQPFFHTIPFLPRDYPALHKVIEVLNKSTGNMPYLQQITLLMQLFDNESIDVKVMTLNRLRSILREHRSELHHLVVNNLRLDGTGTPIISVLTKALLIGCRDPFQKVQVAFTECLGELGAIDPEKFDFTLRSEALEEKNRSTIAQDLIVEYLVRFVGSPSNPTPQDRAAYAIQEILKTCGCVAEPMNRTQEGKDLWNHFNNEVKEILMPYLTSEYSLTDAKPTAERDGAFFKPKVLYKKWLSSWVIDLIKHTKGSYEPIFNACRGIIRDYVKICHYLLPYLIMNVFEFGTQDDIMGIQVEMLEVLKNDTDLSSENGQMCTQRVFEITTALTRWVDGRNKKMKDVTNAKKVSPKSSSNTPNAINTIETFLGGIPELLLSSASLRCGALSSSLLHMESYIRKEIDTKNQSRELVINNNMTTLQKIYHDLNDIDGLVGLSLLNTNPSFDEKIMEFESRGAWSECFVYYSTACNNDPNNVQYKLGQLRSLFHLGHHESVLIMAEGLKAVATEDQTLLQHHGNSTIAQQYNSYSIEAAWRLSKWETVEAKLQQPYEPNFDVSIGQILLDLYRRNEREFVAHLYQARADLTQNLAAASLDSHHRCYTYLTQLHILKDIELSWNLSNKTSETAVITELNERFKVIQPSTLIREPILTVHRVILEIFNHQADTTQCWLRIAKYSRHEGKFENAANALLAPRLIEDRPYFMERAKLAFAKGQTNEAISILGPLCAMGGPNGPTGQPQFQPNKAAMRHNDPILAKTHLLLAKWKQQCGSSHAELLNHYKQACLFNWEKGHFYLGKFYDSVLSNIKKNGTNLFVSNNKSMMDPLLLTKYTKKILSSYGNSLVQGHNYIYHSMTRFLTVWTEYGSTLLDNSDLIKDYKNKNRQSAKINSNNNFDNQVKALKTMVKEFVNQIPAHLWLMFLPQLISRIVHKNPDTLEVIEMIIVKVMTEYPAQANWFIVSLLNSKEKARMEGAQRCFKKACVDHIENKRSYDEISRLSEYFIALCDHDAGKKIIKMSTDFKELWAMKNLSVIVPLQASLRPVLPPSGRYEENFQLFDPKVATIQGFEDQIEIMPSMQKPKKITIIGSQGKRHIFLCKPKDDLRKDSRIMEFSLMVNKLLKKDPHCRRRRLLIRTYSVVPLDELCGMIEWVSNLTGLRNILTDLYKQVPNFPDNKKIREYYATDNPKVAIIPKYDILTKHILPFAPPVFYKWFLKTFPDPSAWLDARNSYTKTTAVCSMVGSMIGLGDRHGENILFDTTNGECLHVDINCVFWKGKTFTVPERVPFRLTRNMVDACGVSGVEGTFRIVCEHTLRLLRANREALMSLLETFVYDPLVEWKGKGGNENDKALEIINNIDRELQGLPANIGLPLSIEGQVTSLIQEATDLKNLSEMYNGWAAWL
ncbi:hypothetical protein SAMD00019534_110690 [Acytostelium subglobosum LB1]|nr:hypothetical protein SAMD00019534_110690 [Acytostelium subglobosum LB1]GAM27893.1 hypothetical protein SAMD00019534_110690 [Acytostelium subglobosum LB1]|eukprot:XP_012749176.1 hypothetical protein SAMD00019534_110690 [Acytostelium subglobosum LB1]